MRSFPKCNHPIAETCRFVHGSKIWRKAISIYNQRLHKNNLAAAGTGLAVLPNIYAATEANRGLDGRIARIDDPSAERTISLLQLASKGTNSDGEILVDALRDGAKTLIQGL